MRSNRSRDWITALRAPAIRQLVEAGKIQVSFFDERDLAGAAMQLRVLIDGVEIGHAVHIDGEGWKPIGAEDSAHAERDAAAATIAHRLDHDAAARLHRQEERHRLVHDDEALAKARRHHVDDIGR